MQKNNNKISYQKNNIMWTIFIISFFILLYFLNSSLEFNKPEDAPIGVVYEKAVVTKITSDTLAPDPDYPYINIGKQYLDVKITSGENKGKIVSVINFVGRTDNKPVKVGTRLVVSSYDDFISTIIVNYNREISIYILLFIFIFVVLFLGKSKGAKSLFSLVFTMICIFFIFIPLIIKGMNPIVSSIIIVILSTMVTMISLNGVTKKTFVASLSCILCTIVAGLIAYIFGKFNNISTFNTAELQDLLFVSTKTSLKVKDLLFAGILISSLGAIMDTTMSITSSIFEMKDIKDVYKRQHLYLSNHIYKQSLLLIDLQFHHRHLFRKSYIQ